MSQFCLEKRLNLSLLLHRTREALIRLPSTAPTPSSDLDPESLAYHLLTYSHVLIPETFHSTILSKEVDEDLLIGVTSYCDGDIDDDYM